MKELVGINLHKPPIEVNHKDLQRSSCDTLYRSICPECKEGFLMVHRDLDTHLLRSLDHCILCGQRYVYMDIPDNKIMFLEELDMYKDA